MKTEVALKTLRLAADPRTPEGEATAAFCAFRRASLPWEELVALLGNQLPHPNRRTPPPPPPPRPPSPIMPFGKHRGMSVDDIARQHPDYLDWVLTNCKNIRPYLRAAIQRALGLTEE